MSSPRDSGEVRPFEGAHHHVKAERSQLASPPTWQWVAGNLIAILGILVMGARWTAQMESDMNTLKVMWTQSMSLQEKRIGDMERKFEAKEIADAEYRELLRLQIANLDTKYAVLNDRMQRSKGDGR